ENVKLKLSQFCQVPVSNIVNLHDVTNIWHIPLLLRDQRAHEAILKVLGLWCVGKVPQEPKLSEWTERASRFDKLKSPVRIAMVGKYTGISDSYLSILKALLHASVALDRKLVVDWVPSCDLEDSAAVEVSTFLPDIILIPLSMMVNILILGIVSLYRRLMPMRKHGVY
uniref:CTP synthase N-terminal domain-containing protein n=1 Tax=Aegilops tauschii subsp. strangulata TaxID=200361 RepID=A0A452ZZ25_AEGTS